MDCINTITQACSTTTAAASTATATATVTVHVPTWVSTCVPCPAATTNYIISEESLRRLTDALNLLAVTLNSITATLNSIAVSLDSIASVKRLNYFSPGWVYVLCFVCFIAGEWMGKKKWLYSPEEADNRVLADVDPATAMVDQQQE